MFEDAFERLWHGHDTIPPIAQQRQSCPPTIATSTVSEQDADSTLAGSHGVDAIVTSPPYFDAIDYNARHREMRQLLGLSRPQVDTLGISQSLAEYSASVKQLSARMFESLVSGGRVVIVSASYHGVDTPRMYETALREAGMGPIVRLARDYRVPTLDITSDEILVMEKP
jgi:hypothetical protein